LLMVTSCEYLQATDSFNYHCDFTKDGWNRTDWMLVKSARWDYFGDWVQNEDHIANEIPAGATNEEMESSKAPETYTSMLLNKQLHGKVSISSTMSFDYQMAPVIVIADKPGKDKLGRNEYRVHVEIIIYNEGLNIWHHRYKDGKQSWTRLTWSNFALKPNTKYDLKVTVTGKEIEVTIDGHVIGCTDWELPDKYYVGITGCEGVNRFYDFKVSGQEEQ